MNEAPRGPQDGAEMEVEARPATSPETPVAGPASMAGASPAAPAAVPPALRSMRSMLGPVAVVLALLSLVINVLLWQRLSGTRQQLARQMADAGEQSVEARTIARQAQESARDTAARVAVTDIKLSEVAVQRAQLEDLIQSLSRSRDENLVVDIESSLRLAQQQAQLTGSIEPLVAALRSADQRIARAAQPRLAPLQRAIARDINRITSTPLSDTPGLLLRMDELLRMADDLPLVNAVAAVSASGSLKRKDDESMPQWWQRAFRLVGDGVRDLIRVSTIQSPEAALLTPEQSFFVRENFKLKVLNARLGLLARQLEPARADMAAATTSLNRYFDPASRKTQAAAGLLQQIQGQMRTLELPRIDDTLAALTTAAAGR